MSLYWAIVIQIQGSLSFWSQQRGVKGRNCGLLPWGDRKGLATSLGMGSIIHRRICLFFSSNFETQKKVRKYSHLVSFFQIGNCMQSYNQGKKHVGLWVLCHGALLIPDATQPTLLKAPRIFFFLETNFS